MGSFTPQWGPGIWIAGRKPWFLFVLLSLNGITNKHRILNQNVVLQHRKNSGEGDNNLRGATPSQKAPHVLRREAGSCNQHLVKPCRLLLEPSPFLFPLPPSSLLPRGGSRQEGEPEAEEQRGHGTHATTREQRRTQGTTSSRQCRAASRAARPPTGSRRPNPTRKTTARRNTYTDITTEQT